MSSPTTVTNDAEIVLDALIDGLRITDRLLNEACGRALHALGPRVTTALSTAAQDARRPSHRRRIIAIIEMIEDLGQLDAHVGNCVWKALIQALRVHNEQLNDKAIEAFSCLPPEAVFELLTEATYRRNSPGFSARLRRAASALGLRRRTYTAS